MCHSVLTKVHPERAVRHPDLYKPHDIMAKHDSHSHITEYPDVGGSRLALIQEALRLPFLRIVTPDPRESVPFE